MRSRLMMIVAIVLALAAVGGAATSVLRAAPKHPATVRAALPPRLAAYLGTFEPGAPPGYGAITEFAQAAGKQPNIVGYYSGWAQPFNMSFAETLKAHGAIPFVQIDPTDASVTAMAAGTYDEYLRSYADSVRNYGHAVIIGFGHEMNAPWYSWGYGHLSPSTFVTAWRHLVTLFRQQGAENVTWVWTLQADEPGITGPVASWWPGGQYVTWVGIDGYYYRPSDTFTSVFGQTIKQVRAITGKPVLLSETAVGRAAGQFVKIQDLFGGMATYNTLGLVWFDKNQYGGVSKDGKVSQQDWRIEDNPAAENSFRLGASRELAPVTPMG
jgi:Glycosyl hydrolase family 26